MIHYTLLPDEEIKSLKREYMTRVFVTLLFFISCGVLAGIISLIPSYIFSYTKESEALKDLQDLKIVKHDVGSDVASKNLSQTQQYISSLKSHQDTIDFAQTISSIVERKIPLISINSFQLTRPTSLASTTVDVLIQGKAATRDALVNFKKNLEKDTFAIKSDLPISDLAKSKDIPFTIKITVETQ